jgi:hypothetical protein
MKETSNLIKIPIRELNPLFTCSLCKGYYQNCFTLTYCLHSFCNYCIKNYLFQNYSNSNISCPKCHTDIGTYSNAMKNMKEDPTIQSLCDAFFPVSGSSISSVNGGNGSKSSFSSTAGPDYGGSPTKEKSNHADGDFWTNKSLKDIQLKRTNSSGEGEIYDNDNDDDGEGSSPRAVSGGSGQIVTRPSNDTLVKGSSQSNSNLGKKQSTPNVSSNVTIAPNASVPKGILSHQLLQGMFPLSSTSTSSPVLSAGSTASSSQAMKRKASEISSPLVQQQSQQQQQPLPEAKKIKPTKHQTIGGQTILPPPPVSVGSTFPQQQQQQQFQPQHQRPQQYQQPQQFPQFPVPPKSLPVRISSVPSTSSISTVEVGSVSSKQPLLSIPLSSLPDIFGKNQYHVKLLPEKNLSLIKSSINELPSLVKPTFKSLLDVKIPKIQHFVFKRLPEETKTVVTSLGGPDSIDLLCEGKSILSLIDLSTLYNYIDEDNADSGTLTLSYYLKRK